MKNWKTTIGGILFSIAQILYLIQTPDWIPYIATSFAVAGGLILGISAQDAMKKLKK
jgi:TM2 domain-containing membrane protein YozV